MQLILTISTFLGGLAAIWFFWDKIKDYLGTMADMFKSQKTQINCLGLPDDEFMFLDKISKLPTKNRFLPASTEETNLYHSLANYGLFKKQADLSFKPTRQGKKFLLRQ